MSRPLKKYHFLYKTTNKVNGKFYVGMHSTDDLNDGYLGSGRYLKRSIKKYGESNFVVEKLEFFDTREALIKREMDYINKIFIKDPLCMNLMTGGTHAPASNLGSKRSAESKLKMGLWVRTDECKKKISIANTGKHPSAKTLVKLREAKLGKKLSDETKSKMSLKKLGIPKSEEHKQNMRKPKSEEHKKKISMTKTGIKLSDETKSKLKLISKDRYPNGFWHKPHTDETKQKLSEKAKARGTKPANRRPFMVGAVRYESLYEARDKLSITLAALRYRLKNKNFNDYQYINK